jgi:hypothetical protein
MECRVLPLPFNNVVNNVVNDIDLLAYFAFFVFLICVECAKEPEFRCENCDKVYKQEGRFRVHLSKCVGVDLFTAGPAAAAAAAAAGKQITDFSELLKQNREMMSIIQKQNETIQVLVSHLSTTGLILGGKE